MISFYVGFLCRPISLLSLSRRCVVCVVPRHLIQLPLHTDHDTQSQKQLCQFSLSLYKSKGSLSVCVSVCVWHLAIHEKATYSVLEAELVWTTLSTELYTETSDGSEGSWDDYWVRKKTKQISDLLRLFLWPLLFGEILDNLKMYWN